MRKGTSRTQVDSWWITNYLLDHQSNLFHLLVPPSHSNWPIVHRRITSAILKRHELIQQPQEKKHVWQNKLPWRIKRNLAILPVPYFKWWVPVTLQNCVRILYGSQCRFKDTGVSVNSGTPKSSTLIGFSIINHPFWGTLIFGNTHTNPHQIRCGNRMDSHPTPPSARSITGLPRLAIRAWIQIAGAQFFLTSSTFWLFWWQFFCPRFSFRNAQKTANNYIGQEKPEKCENSCQLDVEIKWYRIWE